MRNRHNLTEQLLREAKMDGYRSFEASENWENMENFLVAKGVPRPQAREMVLKATQTRPDFSERGGQGARHLTQGGTRGNPSDIAAQLTINVERVTDNIALPLPYVLFGALDSLNGYRRALQGLLPAGVVLTSVDIGETAGQPEAAIFTYTQGVNVDTIRVSCAAAPYPLVLQSTITDTLSSEKQRLSISDQTKTAQFLTDLSVQVRNMWGSVNSRSLNPESFRSPEQFQNGILDINVLVNYDKETMTVGSILNVPNFVVSHAMFVRDFAAWRS